MVKGSINQKSEYYIFSEFPGRHSIDFCGNHLGVFEVFYSNIYKKNNKNIVLSFSRDYLNMLKCSLMVPEKTYQYLLRLGWEKIARIVRKYSHTFLDFLGFQFFKHIF